MRSPTNALKWAPVTPMPLWACFMLRPVYLQGPPLASQICSTKSRFNRGMLVFAKNRLMRASAATIEVTAGLLRRRLTGRPDDVGQIDAILSEVSNLNEVVSNCLDFVRPLSLNLGPTRLETLLDETMASLEGSWREQGIRLVRDYDDNLPPITVDAQKIRQALLNLLVNAGEAVQASQPAPGEGAVTVRAKVVSVDPDARTLQLTAGRVRLEDIPREREECVQIEIMDNGCGMDPVTMDKMFYPFFTTKESGSGIGLAVAQKVVDGHRGFLEVESRPGAGSTFIMRFPLRPPDRRSPGMQYGQEESEAGE